MKIVIFILFVYSLITTIFYITKSNKFEEIEAENKAVYEYISNMKYGSKQWDVHDKSEKDFKSFKLFMIANSQRFKK